MSDAGAATSARDGGAGPYSGSSTRVTLPAILTTLFLAGGCAFETKLTVPVFEVAVVVGETRGAPPLVRRLMAPGDLVAVEFTHSMYGGGQWHVLAVTAEGRLRQCRVLFENEDAARYYEGGGRVSPAGPAHPTWVSGEPSAVFEGSELRFRSSPLSRHRIQLGKTTVTVGERDADPSLTVLTVTPSHQRHPREPLPLEAC